MNKRWLQVVIWNRISTCLARATPAVQYWSWDGSPSAGGVQVLWFTVCHIKYTEYVGFMSRPGMENSASCQCSFGACSMTCSKRGFFDLSCHQGFSAASHSSHITDQSTLRVSVSLSHTHDLNYRRIDSVQGLNRNSVIATLFSQLKKCWWSTNVTPAVRGQTIW
jgi:hypothetical protein